MQRTLGTVRKAVDKYNMISEGDKIAVGVSGGKDSLVLLTALSRLREFYPASFEVIGISIDPDFGGQSTDFSGVAGYCKELSVPFIVEKTLLWDIVFKERNEKNPCSLCSRIRKGALYNAAIRSGCNKVALGHHMDDAAVTFFMSLLKNGTLSCFSPVNHLEEKGIDVIRPLVLTREFDTAGAAKKQKMPVIKSGCTENGCTARSDIALTLKALGKDYRGLTEKAVGAMMRAQLFGW